MHLSRDAVIVSSLALPPATTPAATTVATLLAVPIHVAGVCGAITQLGPAIALPVPSAREMKKGFTGGFTVSCRYIQLQLIADFD